MVSLLTPWRVAAEAVSGFFSSTNSTTQRPEQAGLRPAPPESKAEKQARVASIRLNPAENVVLKSREPMVFSAIPLDTQGNAIHGLKVNWLSSNKDTLFVRPDGRVIAGKPGTAVLSAIAGNKRENVTVQVVEGSSENFGGKKKQDSTRKERAVAKRINDLRIKRAHVYRPSAPMFIRNPSEDPLPDDETTSLYQPANLTGNPPGKKKAGAVAASSAIPTSENGNKNFTFGLPIAGLPGRGIDATLGLIYNSLLYNKSTDPFDSSTWLTYDVDSGYPAQGFRLGYGQIEDQGSAGFTLTDTDGTRHALVHTTGSNYKTTDGTFIDFVGGSGWGTLYQPNGTIVGYGAAGGGYRSYPTTITDRNGNYIYISYRNGVGPRIDSITDTLGRYIRFYYDSNSDLVTITVPGLTGQSDIQVMRFYYENVSLGAASSLFNTGTVNVNTLPSTIRAIRYIYLPASAEGTSSSDGDTGYRFDYSPYGMIRQITKFQGMTASTTSTSSTGTVTEGTNTVAATTTYDYPSSAASLTDAPTYSHRTDDWAGRTTSSAPQYTFEVSESTSETLARVTAPDNGVVETVSIKNSGQWDDGLVKETRIQSGPTGSSPTVYAKTVLSWEQSPSSGPPRVASISETNDAGKTRASVLTYDTSTPYNNVHVVSERDFTTDGSISTNELRKTVTDYVTSTAYLNRHLLHLPASVKILPGGSSTVLSRVDYQYDNYGTSHANMTPRSDILMHDPAFDPFQQTQESCDWVCYQYDPWWVDCVDWRWECTYYNPYDAATDYRGNVTSVTTYSDAPNASGAITHTTTYDIAGNVITADVDCCQQKSFTYTDTYEFAYPTSVTNGDAGGLHLTKSSTYDFNTGAVATTTDENSQVISFSYNGDTLRTSQVDFPDGGRITYDYADALVADSAGKYHSAATVSQRLDSTRYVDSKSYFDGRGAVAATFNSFTSGDGWSIRDVQYDNMGRPYRISNPYYSTSNYGTVAINSAGIWTTRTFDQLGRVTQVTIPRGDDANASLTTTVQTAYAGDVVTMTDQTGKQRRQVSDAMGRIIRLDEPTTAGLGTASSPNQSTSYQYDLLNNLVRITQGSQDRYFKYDSLSRLIRERHPEQNANSNYSLSDSVTGNSSWSKKLEYNSHGLVTHAYDARGIQADFSYDGLNRLTLIDYSDSTPDARYFYDSQTLPSGAPSYTHGYANGRLIAMTYGSSGSTTGTYYGYDSVGRINVQQQVTGSSTYSLSYTYNLGGMLLTETYPTGRVLTHSYDNAGRLSQISDGTTTFASGFSYAASGGMLSETWGNGAVHSVLYNNALQVSQIKLRQSSSGSELQRFDYSYGEVTQSNGSVDKSKNNGQIGRVDGFINGSSTKEWDQRFSYDELGRLSIGAEYQQGTGSTPSWKQEFTYDRYGNRFQSGTANTGVPFTPVVSGDISTTTNRFITSGSTPITYDDAGNITQDKKFRLDPQADGMNYSYDANGRMLTSSATDNAGAQASVYDCSGRRVQTSANSVTRQMVYDVFGKVVAEYKGGSLERENIYRGGQLLAVYEAASSCYKSIDQFIKDFYQGALSRQPNSTELSTWTTKLTQAQARGVDALIGAAQDLGNTLFTSSEYPNTNTNTQFVTDLYESFLQRSPDTGGLNFWAGNVPGDGRENVRRAFALSTEFTDNVAALCVGTSTSASLTYVLTDVQGSGRALMNNSGSGTSTIIARHDYLPFGEEIWAGVGLRTTSQKYAVTDKVRQRFAMTERDEATGLDHTLFRKYDSYAGRWTSPDPYRGSINPMNPQSLNRYSYGNDPVNMIDPTGLCTFNINLTGVSGQQLTDMQNEITRIFESGGHNVVFNNPGAANGGSMNLAVVSSYPANVEAFISNQGANPRNIPGVTMPGTGSAHVNSNVLFFFNPNPYFTQASLGTVEGRVGAHEVVQHGFLGWGPEGWTSDITRSNVRPNTLFKPSTGRFDMSASTAEALGKLCPPDKKPAANAVHELLHGVGGGPDIGFFGGFYGYPSWWYDMWAFVDWVNSIPVGGEREVEINDEGPVQPRPTRPPILKR